jgi:hypothetical protein
MTTVLALQELSSGTQSEHELAGVSNTSGFNSSLSIYC